MISPGKPALHPGLGIDESEESGNCVCRRKRIEESRNDSVSVEKTLSKEAAAEKHFTDLSSIPLEQCRAKTVKATL